MRRCNATRPREAESVAMAPTATRKALGTGLATGPKRLERLQYSVSQQRTSTAKVMPCTQKSAPLKLNCGRATVFGPLAGGIKLGLTARSICSAGRTTLLQNRKL